MPYDDPTPQRTQEVRKAQSTAHELQSACETAADMEGEVVVAIRDFPSSEYKYLYNPHDISIVRAKLIMNGYSVDSKTVMDSKCSKLVLVIESDTIRRKIVHAEKLK